MAVTRVCPGVMTSGTPFGTVVARLSTSSRNCPRDVTRVAAVVNCAVTHGGPPDEIAGNVQPAMVYVVAMVTTGWPLIVIPNQVRVTAQ